MVPCARAVCVCLLTYLCSTPVQINDVLSDDLSLTTTLLKQHPKVYWIWNHRQWCLRQVPDGPTDADPNGWRQSYWNKELFVVEKMLEVDPRNCQCPWLLRSGCSLIMQYSSCLDLPPYRAGEYAREASRAL